jgi:hypothetical protein
LSGWYWWNFYYFPPRKQFHQYLVQLQERH